MIYRKVERDIKEVATFLELWGKFHSLYNEIIAKDNISKEDETKFLETKNLIKNKYEILRSGLDFKYMPHTRLTDPVADILAVTSWRFMAQSNLEKLENDWRDSYIFLNSIRERLENKKRRLEEFNPVGVFLKRLFERG
jgi:hypothetical protein